MNAFYLRPSKFVGFGSAPATLWTRLYLGWFVLDIFPGPIADRIDRIIREMRK
jgi:hypothetical protein